MTDATSAPDWRRPALALGLVMLLAALAIGVVLARYGGDTKPADRRASIPPGTTARPPAVEPVVVADIAPEAARKINAAAPFLTSELVPARPFTFAGSSVDRERAVTCLASAAWYEAGDDAEGERAVVQVVLNRVRHPAFPKTVCGVVFQGSERATGCQFTFTCDGALARQPSDAAWKRGAGDRVTRTGRRCRSQRGHRDPLPYRLGRAVLELVAGQDRRCAHAPVLPLARLVG